MDTTVSKATYCVPILALGSGGIEGPVLSTLLNRISAGSWKLQVAGRAPPASESPSENLGRKDQFNGHLCLGQRIKGQHKLIPLTNKQVTKQPPLGDGTRLRRRKGPQFGMYLDEELMAPLHR
ncbi:hypothetical protein NDU88_011471 [Pleurodeles waltl]|uniref:Uncharacterized protein n=1 Tax=Pleurodeles waltl TaxID=8319 RepID=A0AAV7R138_PLEWA|nr:hypothetical protein NDU88_011471 [Pleurodeles waltl]